MNEELAMEIIMPIILHAGNAKSLSMEAIQMAKKGKFEDAEKAISDASDALNEAHHVQTDLLQKEAGGKGIILSLLMVHAQDHLMTSIAVKDLANEMIDMYKVVKK